MATQSPSPQNPAEGPELSKPVEGNGQLAQGEAANDTSERPFLAPSEPMREDQVQNAVNFLSHPKVRGSPVIYRRSFLEKKGLTKEEIDEAFRRVPDPPSNATSVEAAATNQVSQLKPSSSLQPQAPTQSPQPASVPISSVSVVPSVQQSRFQWSHALIAAGVLAASGAGTAVFFKNVIVPRLKTWVRKVVAEGKESEKEDKSYSVLTDQTAEAAKAAVTAAAVVAKASEELLNSKNEERKYFEAFMSMMDVQVKEMKSIGEAMRKLESTRENGHSQNKMVEEYIRSNIGNGTTNNSWRTPQVNQSDTSLTSALKPVKVNGTANPNYAAVRPSSAPANVEPTTAPQPKSYMEPWEVPQQKPSYSVPPPPQPSGEGLSSGNEESGHLSDPNGRAPDSSEPWWKKKTVKKAVKITEIEPEAEELRQQHQQLPYSAGGSLVRPIQRSWVPPQPPTVAIPEAAAAIRQPKSSVQKQQSVEMVSDDGEGSVASDDTRIGMEVSNPSEIEEEREGGVEMS